MQDKRGKEHLKTIPRINRIWEKQLRQQSAQSKKSDIFLLVYPFYIDLRSLDSVLIFRFFCIETKNFFY